MTSKSQNELVHKAIAVLESFESGNPEAITAYVHQKQYIQHNHIRWSCGHAWCTWPFKGNWYEGKC